MLKITEITVLPDYKMLLTFSTGEKKVFDFKTIYRDGVFQELQDSAYFAQVRNGGYFIEWPHEQDLSAETLYAEGIAAESAAQNLKGA